MPGLTQDETAELFLAACRAEINALKPGNVHIHAAGHGMEVAQFEASAAAAAPWITAPQLNVGARILRGTQASLAAAGCNTNLGILLLAAPLAAAAQAKETSARRARLGRVLARLDAQDALDVYSAIRFANPGGLGTAPEEDVSAPPTIGLLDAMALAADRDRIARAYITDFAEIFEFGLPLLDRARQGSGDSELMVTALHMAYLAEQADSHIARKFGNAIAEQVRKEALRHKHLWHPGVEPSSFAELLAFDADLKRRNVNPGTTADFVVGTLFAASIRDRLHLSSSP